MKWCCFKPLFSFSARKTTSRLVSSIGCCFSMDSVCVLFRYIFRPSSPFFIKLRGVEFAIFFQKEGFQIFPIKREGVGKLGGIAIQSGRITFHTT